MLAADPPQRFFPSTCPVCGEPALEVGIAPGRLEYECSRCGGYDITTCAKSVMNRRTEKQRKAWLARARRLVSANTLIPVIDLANEPNS
jgi:hypothetical protein